MHYANTGRRLKRLLAGLKVRRVLDLKAHDLQEWRASRLADGVANRTANMDVSTLKSMLRWAIDADLLTVNPLARLKPLPEGKKHQKFRRRALTESEITKFLSEAAKDDDREADRLAAVRTRKGGTKGRAYAERARAIRVPQLPLWLAFLETGARWGALTKTVWSDLDEQKCTLRLRAENAKAEKEQSLPLRRAFVEQMLELRKLHDDVLGRKAESSECIFLTPLGEAWSKVTANAMRIFDRVLDAAEIEKWDGTGQKLDIHALRHTFGTRLLRAGAGLIQVQRLLGHSDPKLTAQTYSHLLSDDLRVAVELLPTTATVGGGGSARRIDGTKVALTKGSLTRVARKSLSEMERVIGIEPTTFSLGTGIDGR
ncbi:MAG: site-specific integrase [Planctomycetota bacterium]